MLNFLINDSLGDARDSSNQTLLHHSARNRQTDLAKLLIRQGCDVDAQDNDGMTPLMLATLNRDDETVRVLLRAKADVYVENNWGTNVLQLAFTAPVMERRVLLQLLHRVQNASYTTEEIAARLIEAACPLRRAVLLRNAAVTRRMIELGVDVEARNAYCEWTALFHAAVECDPETVRLLLDHKADVNATEFEGFNVVGRLHECRCDCEKCANRGREKLEVLRILVDAGASLTSITSYGLFQASTILRQGSREVVRLVLRSIVDFAVKDRYGQTILDYAVQNANPGVIDEVKHHIHKFDVNAYDDFGTCALLKAVEFDNPEAVKLLLDNGANANCSQEPAGETPLYKCFPLTSKVGNRYDECAEILLQANADPQVVCNYLDAPTVFDAGMITGQVGRLKLVVARLAMMERLGAEVTELSRCKIELRKDLGKYFEQCRRVLRLKCGGADLFELLTVDEEVLECRLSDPQCLRRIVMLSGRKKFRKVHAYYCNTLRKRVAGILCVREDSCEYGLPRKVSGELDISELLIMKEKILARHLRCAECLRDLVPVCFDRAKPFRGKRLKKRIVSIVYKTDLRDRAAVGVAKIFDGRLSTCHLVMKEILGYLDDKSLERVSWL